MKNESDLVYESDIVLLVRSGWILDIFWKYNWQIESEELKKERKK